MGASVRLVSNLTTSKGNQIKARKGNYWYKVDYLGYEGLAEFLCTKLLTYTNIEEFVKYQMLDIEVGNSVCKGCISPNFLQDTESIMTADRLFKAYKGVPIVEYLKHFHSMEERICNFVKTVEEITGITQYGAALTKMLEWDGFVLNDDRHFNNIAFVYNDETKQFKLSPLFDNGASFLSDTKYDYPMEKNVYGLMASVKAKPFSDSFDEQLDVCEKLYGVQLTVDHSIAIVPAVMQSIIDQYGEPLAERVNEIFRHQLAMTDYLR